MKAIRRKECLILTVSAHWTFGHTGGEEEVFALKNKLWLLEEAKLTDIEKEWQHQLLEGQEA